ncbi:hypothetical protein SNE40_004045 [Patella caerulea]|uniref:IGFBP N-terminal domain-containing protein n=1 Tax=Patella caerulea TaxID=87958 RepID=A0AAN8K966_PATCE
MKCFVFVVIVVFAVHDTDGRSYLNLPMCTPNCDNVQCPQESSFAGCERDLAYCTCCEECTGEIGATCNADTVRCRTGLVCRNNVGEERQLVWPTDKAYQGTCRQPSGAGNRNRRPRPKPNNRRPRPQCN